MSTTQGTYVPFFLPEIGEEEIASVVETLRSGWLTTGPKTKLFEERFAQKVEAPQAVAVNSATAALHLALEALGVGPGDEVIVPTMTFTATASVAVHLGAKPVLVDVEPDTLNLDPARIEAACTPRTKVVMPVHYAGQPCELDPILEIARRRGLRVVDDAAHALPTRYRGRMIGSLTDITAFSFYANKTITTGEGGMATTADDQLADRMRRMALHGMSRDAWKRFTKEGSWYYEVLEPGYKYNLSDVASAIGLHQLAKCDRFWEARRERAGWYDELLADVPEVAAPRVRPDVQHAWHLYVVQLQLDRLRIGRNEFIQELNAAQIGTSVHYVPLHRHPYYQRTLGHEPGDFPVADALYDRIISLPLYTRMTRDDVERVVDAVRSIAARHRR